MRINKYLVITIIVICYFLKRANSNTTRLGDSNTDFDLKTVLEIEKQIHPDIKNYKVKELGPKNSFIFSVKFLKPDYCQALVRLLEKADWDSKSKKNYGQGMTLPLDFIPKIEEEYSRAVKKYIYPLVAKLFPTFNPTHHDEVYILRYRADQDSQKQMEVHYDSEPLACILALNRKFKGGGTIFPKFNLKILAQEGEVLLYPGGLGHLHGGLPISEGRRYLLLQALYDKKINGTAVATWDEDEPQHQR